MTINHDYHNTVTSHNHCKLGNNYIITTTIPCTDRFARPTYAHIRNNTRVHCTHELYTEEMEYITCVEGDVQ